MKCRVGRERPAERSAVIPRPEIARGCARQPGARRVRLVDEYGPSFRDTFLTRECAKKGPFAHIVLTLCLTPSKQKAL